MKKYLSWFIKEDERYPDNDRWVLRHDQFTVAYIDYREVAQFIADACNEKEERASWVIWDDAQNQERKILPKEGGV